MKKLWAIALISSVFLLQACGTGRTLVLEPSSINYPVKSIMIKRASSPSQVPEESFVNFENILRDKLKESGFVEGVSTADLTIHYRFVHYDEGDRFSRWVLGGLGNAGEGSMTIEAKFYDKFQKAVGKIHTEGKIGSGAFGGGFDNAIEQAADSFVQYISQNFN